METNGRADARHIEVFRPELHSFPLRAMIDEARETLGEAKLAEILGRYRLKPSDLTDTSAWVSLDFVESFFQALVDESKDPELVDRAAIRSMTRKYLGPLYPLFIALESPLFAYRQLPSGSGRHIKTGRYACEDARPGFVRLAWTPANNVRREATPFICRTRIVQLSRFPALFGAVPGEARHPQCLLRGDDACVYELSWRERPPRAHGSWGALAGAAIGALLAAIAGASAPLVVFAASGFSVAGWALGLLWVTREELRERVQDIVEHNRWLDRVTQTNEERFKELQEAKTEVDKKVEQRTAELQEASARLAATLERLQELDRAKTNFFSNVSHELRTPLTLILGPLRYLARGDEPPGGTKTAFAAMHRNAEQLLELITDVLDLAKIDAGAMPIRRVAVDAVELVKGVLLRFEAAARERDVAIAVEAPPDPVSAHWDKGWIERALANLVANALRHVARGGHVTLRLCDAGAGAVARLEVEDDGEGIDAAELDQVFERFAQASPVAGRGTGLGLAIVREVARLHGGDASVRSERGKGTAFALDLPRGLELEAPTVVSSVGHQAGQASPIPASLGVTTDAAVPDSWRTGPYEGAPLALVVEDDDDLRAFTAGVLAAHFRVRTAPDGARGLELAIEMTPDVVVSDVAMPKLDGIGLCRALRERKETSAVPVILVTAATEPAQVLRGFEVGASDYVVKPFRPEELLARVNVHVRVRQLVREIARRERLAMLGGVAAAVAHQVRNPLTTLVSGLPAMRRRLGERLDAPSAELVDAMIDCAERIRRTTNDLLDLSRVDRAEDDELSPGVGLLAAVRLARTRFASGGVEIHVDVDDSTTLRGRGGDLNQVFLNLLDNAARAVGTRGRIDVRAARENDVYIVQVGDSGPGVPAEVTSRVFEPFWTSRPAGEGSGLGLAIAKQVVEQHRGTIVLGHSPLGGALFTIRLPLPAASREPSSQKAQRSAPGGGAESARRIAKMDS